MTNLTKLAAVAVAALVASTSLASAGGLTIKPGTIKVIKLAPSQNAASSQLPNLLRDNLRPPILQQVCLASDPQCNPIVDLANFPILKLPKKPTITFPLIPIHFLAGTADSTQPNPQFAVDCEVHSPAATTDDMFVINTGNAQLPSGTQITYRVNASGDHGGFLLPASLAVGAKLRIPGLLHAAESGAPCAARIVT